MEYGAKWIRENLGISRDELRSYEKAGLIPIKKDGCFYRTYNDNEIERIWYIRVFKGMGYTLKELREIAENDDFDYGPTIEDKIKELEYKKSQIEKHIGLANYIKLTVRFPSRPKKIGDMKFKEFQEYALDNWNVNSNPNVKKYKNIIDTMLNSSDDGLSEEETVQVTKYMMELEEQLSNKDAIFLDRVLPNEILKRKAYGPADTEVQLLVKMMYENCNELKPNVTKDIFVRYGASSFMYGDVAKLREKAIGKEGCRFIADAIAVFGGYSCYEEIKD